MITEENPWAGKNLPPITDHAFWRMLRVQCNTDKPMAQIASELGVDVGDLCDWIMRYREPKKVDKPLSNAKYGPAIAPDRSPGANARDFIAWKKQHEGAAATRRMHEVADR